MGSRSLIPDQRKDLVRRWIAGFNSGDTGGAETLVAEVFVEHALAPFGSDEPGPVDGPRHYRDAVAWLLAQFPDLRMSIEAVAAEDDLVVALMTSTGTNLGPLNGMAPPTGRAFTAQQSHWFRVSEGRLAEHWATRDDLGTMLQLGVIARPGGPTRRPEERE